MIGGMPQGADTDRVDAFLGDILAAPDELAAILAGHARAIAGLPAETLAHPRWRLAGMGSSGFAALDAAIALRAAGLDAAAEIASASDPSPTGTDTLAIVISSSGHTRQVLAAAERHRGSSFVLALTGRPDSPLAAAADAVIPLVAARAETSGIASLTYRATVAALSMLADVALGRPAGAGLTAAVPALEALAHGRHRWLGAAADVLDGGRVVHVVGDGSRVGTAQQAALMLREAPRIPAVAFDTGDWLHVGLYTLFPGDPVLLLAGSSADDEVIATIRSRGGSVVVVGPERRDADVEVPLPEAVLVDPAVRALVEPVVAELLAAELWRRTSAEG